jgi:hypothetical protein
MRSAGSRLRLWLLAAVLPLGCAGTFGTSTGSTAAQATPSTDPQADKPCMYSRERGEWRRCLLAVGSGSTAECVEYGDRCKQGR